MHNPGVPVKRLGLSNPKTIPETVVNDMNKARAIK